MSENGTALDRRRALGISAAVAGVGLAAAACGSSSQPSGKQGNVQTVNDLVTQQGNISITAYDRVLSNPECKYPSTELNTSTELINLRKKLLMFNEPTKLGWAYLFTPQGQLIAYLPVQGKISSTQSSMTDSGGIYSTNDNGGVLVNLPTDDLSYGPNEGGDSGKFFFTPDGIYVFWDGPILYTDTELNILSSAAVLSYPKNAKTVN